MLKYASFTNAFMEQKWSILTKIQCQAKTFRKYSEHRSVYEEKFTGFEYFLKHGKNECWFLFV